MIEPTEFWRGVERIALKVKDWPEWKRRGSALDLTRSKRAPVSPKVGEAIKRERETVCDCGHGVLYHRAWRGAPKCMLCACAEFYEVTE